MESIKIGLPDGICTASRKVWEDNSGGRESKHGIAAHLQTSQSKVNEVTLRELHSNNAKINFEFRAYDIRIAGKCWRREYQYVASCFRRPLVLWADPRRQRFATKRTANRGDRVDGIIEVLVRLFLGRRSKRPTNWPRGVPSPWRFNRCDRRRTIGRSVVDVTFFETLEYSQLLKPPSRVFGDPRRALWRFLRASQGKTLRHTLLSFPGFLCTRLRVERKRQVPMAYCRKIYHRLRKAAR